MKKIYAVYHYWDNGQNWEDLRSYEEVKLFSSYELAERYYFIKTYDDYVGYYKIVMWVLDTNEQSTILESSWRDTEDCYSYGIEEEEEYYFYAKYGWNCYNFDEDYEKALEEVNRQEAKEQWILKQARNAARSNADMSKAWWAFLNKYPLTLKEQCDFWDEYYTTKYQDILYYNLKH